MPIRLTKVNCKFGYTGKLLIRLKWEAPNPVKAEKLLIRLNWEVANPVKAEKLQIRLNWEATKAIETKFIVHIVEQNGRIHEDLKLKQRSKLKLIASRHLFTVLVITRSYKLRLTRFRWPGDRETIIYNFEGRSRAGNNLIFVLNKSEEDVETQEIIIDPDDQPMRESAKIVAPTPNSAIVRPDVDNNFVINSTQLEMIWENKFNDILRADPHDHIREFLAIYDMFKYGETQSEAVKLLIFPFFLMR
ncbi:hypothetical protein Tco_1490915 [Tanacetum coccineum]